MCKEQELKRRYYSAERRDGPLGVWAGWQTESHESVKTGKNERSIGVIDRSYTEALQPKAGSDSTAWATGAGRAASAQWGAHHRQGERARGGGMGTATTLSISTGTVAAVTYNSTHLPGVRGLPPASFASRSL